MMTSEGTNDEHSIPQSVVATDIGRRGCALWKQFLEDRDWASVKRFYEEALMSDHDAMTAGRFPISGTGSNTSFWVGIVDSEQAAPSPDSGSFAAEGHARSHWREERATFLAEIAYLGANFSGLQRAPGLRTIAGVTLASERCYLHAPFIHYCTTL